MARLSLEETRQYSHSPVHNAIACGDYEALTQILKSLPSLPLAGEVQTESESIIAEQKAEMVSVVIDRRDVPGRETPLHLAVRLGDVAAVEMLMTAGADWSLQNQQGWSALQEAICAREDGIAVLISKYSQPMAWAKWCRRLPRITAAMRQMQDFYMEISFNFESLVIPFLGRIAPSDTYKIWKRGSNLRADMTLAGFDGFKIQRTDQSLLFLGEGSEDGKVPSGSLLMLTHKAKEVSNALEDTGTQPSEAEIDDDVAEMCQTNVLRPGIDVTRAVLIPQLTWRHQQKTEMVGHWPSKVFDMHHVTFSLKSKKVPAAVTDEELFLPDSVGQETNAEENFGDLLSEEERQQLESALEKMDDLDISEVRINHKAGVGIRNGGYDEPEDAGVNKDGNSSFFSAKSNKNQEVDSFRSPSGGRKNWFNWGKNGTKNGTQKKPLLSGIVSGASVSANNGNSEKKMSRLTVENGRAFVEKKPSNAESEQEVNRKIGDEILQKPVLSRTVAGTSVGASNGNPEEMSVRLTAGNGRASVEKRPSTAQMEEEINTKKGNDKFVKRVSRGSKDSASRPKITSSSNGKLENEFKLGLRPVLWLASNFPLKTEELLPLLDILANKVKAIRRLRELLTTKLPSGTFPVKVAIPLVPTIRVVVTFNKFEEMWPSEEFCTPFSSPVHLQDSKAKESETPPSSSSWFSWMKSAQTQAARAPARLENHMGEELDPFVIPSDYIWIDINEKMRRMKAIGSETKKGKRPAQRSAGRTETEGGG